MKYKCGILTPPSREINRQRLFIFYLATNNTAEERDLYTRRGKTTSWDFVRYNDELLPTSQVVNIHDEGWSSSYRQSNVCTIQQLEKKKTTHALVLKITFTLSTGIWLNRQEPLDGIQEIKMYRSSTENWLKTHVSIIINIQILD